MVVVKSGCGFFGLGTLKFALLMKWGDFLHGDTNLGKLKVTLIIIGWA